MAWIPDPSAGTVFTRYSRYKIQHRSTRRAGDRGSGDGWGGEQRQETESAGEFGTRLHWSGRALRWSEVNAMATYDVVRVRWQLRYWIHNNDM